MLTQFIKLQNVYDNDKNYVRMTLFQNEMLFPEKVLYFIIPSFLKEKDISKGIVLTINTNFKWIMGELF